MLFSNMQKAVLGGLLRISGFILCQAIERHYRLDKVKSLPRGTRESSRPEQCQTDLGATLSCDRRLTKNKMNLLGLGHRGGFHEQEPALGKPKSIVQIHVRDFHRKRQNCCAAIPRQTEKL